MEVSQIVEFDSDVVRLDIDDKVKERKILKNFQSSIFDLATWNNKRVRDFKVGERIESFLSIAH